MSIILNAIRLHLAARRIIDCERGIVAIVVLLYSLPWHYL